MNPIIIFMINFFLSFFSKKILKKRKKGNGEAVDFLRFDFSKTNATIRKRIRARQ